MAGARRRLTAVLALAALVACTAARADSLSFCGQALRSGTPEADRLLQLGSLVEKLLSGSGAQTAIVSRSGLDLRRFGIRYSHSGIAIRPAEAQGWQVRQLYFDCKENRPRIFDQGVPGFVLSQDDDKAIYVSLLFLPRTEEALLGQGAADKRLSLALLGGEYSANAYPFSTRYQNCNQWVAEMIAHAWGGLGDRDGRGEAQNWLEANDYRPSEIRVNPLYMFASRFVPFLHRSDHPDAEIAGDFYRVSMPAAIESFVLQRAPATIRTELCLRGRTVVIHQGWQAIAGGCQPAEGDTTVALD